MHELHHPFMFYLQLSYESSNAEAVGNLNTIGPLKTEIAYAKELYFGNEFEEAIEALGSVIEVSIWSYFVIS